MKLRETKRDLARVKRYYGSDRGVRRNEYGKPWLEKRAVRVVVSDRMQRPLCLRRKTVLHPKYKKILRRRTKVKAHYERNECHVGDRVLIVECRPVTVISVGASANPSSGQDAAERQNSSGFRRRWAG